MRTLLLTSAFVLVHLLLVAQPSLDLARYRVDGGATQTQPVGESAMAWLNDQVAALPAGSHLIEVEFRTSDGTWSHPFATRLFVDSIGMLTPPKIDIVQAWWNDETANAVVATAVNGNFNQAIAQAAASMTPPGIGTHRLSVRYGAAGTVFVTMIHVADESSFVPPSISVVDVWWNDEVGDPVSALAVNGDFGQAIVEAAATLTPPGVGTHRLSVRYGAPGTVFVTMVHVAEDNVFEPPMLSVLDVWWNDDAANAVSTLAVDGDFNAAIGAALTQVLAPDTGSHVLNVRFNVANGGPAEVFALRIHVEPDLEISLPVFDLAEAWWGDDTDNAVPLVVLNNDWKRALSEASASLLVDLAAGSHLLNVRFGDDDPESIFSIRVWVEDDYEPEMDAIEVARVYFDNNPSSEILLAFSGAGSYALREAIGQVNSTLLDTGYHWMHVQFAQESGLWSPPFTMSIYIEPCETSPVSIASLSGTLNLCPNDSLQALALSEGASYRWYRNAQLAGTEPGLTVNQAGYYYLVTYDSLGCASASDPFIVNLVGTPELVVNGNVPLPLCAGQSITLSASTGFISYTWNTGASGSTVTTSTPGTYQLTALTADGCEVFSQPIEVNVLPQPPIEYISVTGSLVLCEGESVELAHSGGMAVTWSSGFTGSSISVSQEGSYSYQYADSTGCTITSEPVNVQLFAPQALIANGTEVSLCEGNSVTLEAGVGPNLSYRWFVNGDELADSNSPSLIVSNAGTYAVEVTQENCSAVSPGVIVTIAPLPNAQISGVPGSLLCLGDAVELSVSEGAAWSWSTGATTSAISVTASGEYQVLVTGANGCQNLSEPVQVSFEQLVASFSVEDLVLFDPELTTSFSTVVTGAVAQYEWDFGDGGTSSDAEPEYTYSQFGVWDVSLTVTGVSGCTQTITGFNLVQTWRLFGNNPYQLPDGVDINSVSFLSGSVGCVVLANGTVLATEDGGSTLNWMPVYGPVGGSLNSIQLFGNAVDNTAVVVGDGGFAAIITEPGGTWITPATGTQEDLYIVAPGQPGTDNLYAGGGNGTVLEHINGNWNPIPIPGETGPVNGIQYWNGQIFAATGSGMFYGWNGSFWNLIFSDWGPRSFYTMTFGPGGIAGAGWGLIGGPSGSIWQSHNGGATWTEYHFPYPYPITSITIVNELIAYCVGQGGILLYTDDGGETWTPYSIGTDDDLTGIDVSECRGYATARDGRYYTFDLPGYEHPQPVIEGASSGTLCSLSLPVLSVENPRAGYSYVWSTGATGLEIPISGSGDYFVTEIGLCGTTVSDTLNIIVETAIMWYIDEDGDGHGAIGSGILACEAPGPNYALTGIDCDDTNHEVIYCCPGDLNSDGQVNSSDLAILLSAYGTSCAVPFCLGDLNGDAMVNSGDLNLFLSYYGAPCD